MADKGLRSKAFWSHEELPWAADLEKGFDDVRKELLALRGRGGFQVGYDLKNKTIRNKQARTVPAL